MSEETDEKVVKLGVRFKSPPAEDAPILKIVNDWGTCQHRHWPGTMRPVSYNIREGETEVECGCCGVRLDPMFVLRTLAGRESQYEENRRRAADVMKRLDERSRTKCQHCDKMTKISRR